MIAAEAWERAACKDSDPAIFSHQQDGGRGFRDFEEARELCSKCEIRLLCLTDALTHPPTWLHEDMEGGHMQVTAGYSMFQAGLTPRELTTLAQQRTAS